MSVARPPGRRSGPDPHPGRSNVVEVTTTTDSTTVAELDDIRPRQLRAWASACHHLAHRGLAPLPPEHVRRALVRRGVVAPMSGDFAAGYELGHHSGYEVGYAAAEADIAEAWSAEVHRIRALAQPDDYMARVAAALSITGGEAMDPAGSMGERSACQQAADHRR